MNTIQKIDDYSVLKRVEGNRGHSKPHIKRLVDAISKDAGCIKYNPILINEKNEVIDGQHRLEAIKELGLPVYAIQENGLTLENVQALNANTKVWSPMDYAKSFSELGNHNYADYINFKKHYKLNHDVLLQYLALDRPMTGEMFKQGKLVVPHLERSDALCKKLMDFERFYKRFKIRSFALAFKKVWEHPQYDHERMLLKLNQRPDAITDEALPENYVRQLENLYNHGLSAENKLRFF